MKKLILIAILIFSTVSFAQAFTLTTGSKTGVYYNVAAKEIVRQIDKAFDIKILESKGSIENLMRLKNKEADGAIVQFDSLITYGKNLKLVIISKLYNEYVHLIARKNSDFDSIKDYDKKTKLAIGRVGSGTHVTWNSFCKEDESYKEIPTDILSGALAFAALSSGKIDGILQVSGLKSPNIVDYSQSGEFKLIDVNDADFNDTKYQGERVYNFTRIDSDIYPKLITGFFNGSVKTLEVPAILVVTEEWAQNNPDQFDILYAAGHRISTNLKAKLDQ